MSLGLIVLVKKIHVIYVSSTLWKNTDLRSLCSYFRDSICKLGMFPFCCHLENDFQLEARKVNLSKHLIWSNVWIYLVLAIDMTSLEWIHREPDICWTFYVDKNEVRFVYDRFVTLKFCATTVFRDMVSHRDLAQYLQDCDWSIGHGCASYGYVWASSQCYHWHRIIHTKNMIWLI